MRIGILLGGKSREREISFAGGRTVYDIIEKNLFEPVPVFIDSLGNFILLEWQYLYKGSIRDFYPPTSFLPGSSSEFNVYIESLQPLTEKQQDEMIASIGRKISPEELAGLMDFAFLTLHGPYGEDGTIQGILDFYHIPYTGSGILSSAIGIDKVVQKRLLKNSDFATPEYLVIPRQKWLDAEDHYPFYEEAIARFGFPLVIKASSQGSSIGVQILDEANEAQFTKAVYRCFFTESVDLDQWNKFTEAQKIKLVKSLTDFQEGIGLPVEVTWQVSDIESNSPVSKPGIANHPEELLTLLDKLPGEGKAFIESLQTEPHVLIERFIKGKEFSCIVVQNEQGRPVALPPTEIRKKGHLFDYRAKYLPGISNKITPIELPDEKIEEIRQKCEELFDYFHFNVYARLDGILGDDGTIYLNDPNTTSGMLPSSFFFHQAAEIGLSPSQFLTYIVRTSVAERMRFSFSSLALKSLLQKLDTAIAGTRKEVQEKTRVGVILGGYSTERHISVESGRNVFEKLASFGMYDPVPLFLSGSADDMRFHILPLNLLLKDNADDIRHKIKHFSIPLIIKKIIGEAEDITAKYASAGYEFSPVEIPLEQLNKHIDFAFIALHGRPGEDGTLQQKLEELRIPYNGSGFESSQITIDKFRTNQILKEKGFKVPKSIFIDKKRWEDDTASVLGQIEEQIAFPLIAKPSDDGCSSAVKKIDSPDELKLFAEIIFRKDELLPEKAARQLHLKLNEEFPQKTYFIVEELISRNGAQQFLEITGGMLIKPAIGSESQFEVFEPSEALAGAGILSLEEKFLAGEGQNITPARFHRDKEKNQRISSKVREQLEKAAGELGIEGYCRIDAFVRIYEDEGTEVVFIEANSLPGLTPATCIFHQAAINGYKPQEFLDKIINFGILKATAH
ncbi:MAG: D-alanine--D-alanine ligase [Bacteroidia bacterium]